MHRRAVETGSYDKLNRLMWCPLDCLNDTCELARYGLAGSMANLAAAVVPREANWYLDSEETFAQLVAKAK